MAKGGSGRFLKICLAVVIILMLAALTCIVILQYKHYHASSQEYALWDNIAKATTAIWILSGVFLMVFGSKIKVKAKPARADLFECRITDYMAFHDKLADNLEKRRLGPPVTIYCEKGCVIELFSKAALLSSEYFILIKASEMSEQIATEYYEIFHNYLVNATNEISLIVLAVAEEPSEPFLTFTKSILY